MSKRYTIEKITDILDIPEDRFDDFLVELKTYYELSRPWAELIKETAEISGFSVDVVPMKMVWNDDGKRNVTVKLTTPQEAGEAAEGSAA